MRFDVRVTADMVKAEAERRIVDRYPIWRQINIMDEGGDVRAQMRSFISQVRTASNRIEAMKPIPPDYAADQHWN
jgi:hypothetical protein